MKTILVLRPNWRLRVPFAFLLAVSAGAGLAELGSGPSRRALLAAGIAAIVLALSLSRPPFSIIAAGAFERVEELRVGEWRALRY